MSVVFSVKKAVFIASFWSPHLLVTYNAAQAIINSLKLNEFCLKVLCKLRYFLTSSRLYLRCLWCSAFLKPPSKVPYTFAYFYNTISTKFTMNRKCFEVVLILSLTVRARVVKRRNMWTNCAYKNARPESKSTPKKYFSLRDAQISCCCTKLRSK